MYRFAETMQGKSHGFFLHLVRELEKKGGVIHPIQERQVSVMSKGSPRIIFRLKEEDLEILDETIDRNNLTVKGEPWRRSSWVRAAIEERLRHQERSRNKRPKNGSQINTSSEG